MKKITILAALLLSSNIFAAPIKSQFAPVTWESRDPTNIITIDNSNNHPLAIFITAYPHDMNLNPLAGINLKNCGSIMHINAGSSVVCYNQDTRNPLIFSADSNKLATGTYAVEQQQ